MRYLIGVVAATIGLLAAPVQAVADAYPTRPVEVLVPYPPGGTADLLARLVSGKLSDQLGQSIVVINRGGAGGNIAARSVATAANDGYTLLFGNVAVFAINPNLYKKVPFDPIRDFAPISLVASVPQMLVVHPSMPVKSLKEFVNYVKSRPGQVNYAAAGHGSATQLAMELLQSLADIQLFRVAYKGSGPALAGIAGGQVSAMFENIPTALPFVRDSRLRALAVTSAKRSSLLPDLPTVAESGFPGFEITAWFGLQAPAGTSVPIVAKLNEAIGTVVRSDDMRERMSRLGAEPVTNTPAEFQRFIKDELAKWGALVKRSGATID